METSSKPTWILVARRSGATVFSSHGRNEPLAIVREFEHPQGRLKAQMLETDRPGRSFDRAGHGRHSLASEESPTEHLDQQFVDELAAQLDRARHLGEFDSLVVIAAPKLLGRLRAAWTDPMRKIVSGELAKDLVEPDEREIRKQLAEIARV